MYIRVFLYVNYFLNIFNFYLTINIKCTHLFRDINTLLCRLELGNQFSNMLAFNSGLKSTFLLGFLRSNCLGLLKAFLRSYNNIMNTKNN